MDLEFEIEVSTDGSDAEDDCEDQLLGSPGEAQSGVRQSALKKIDFGSAARSERHDTPYDDEEFGDDEQSSTCCRKRYHEERCFTGDTIAHWCYICVFLTFLIMFPFFLKWMIHAPVPQESWNKNYKPFPFLEDWEFVQDKVGTGYNISMSPIPMTWSGCNHSCGRSGNLRASSEMNFAVNVQFEAPSFKHTAYPVLLASNNFKDWHVAADKRHAEPQEFFASDTSESGRTHRHVTDSCTRPPQDTDEETFEAVDHFTSSPTYLMVCVTWSWLSVEWHRHHRTMNSTEVGLYCDSVGGTCGSPCGGGPVANSNLPGCLAGRLSVDKTWGRVAGMTIDNASFQGDVTVRPCITQPGDPQCTSSDLPMSSWPCHKCYNQTRENFTLFYDSLPQLEVLLKNADIDSMPESAIEPHAYVLSSPLNKAGTGPAAMSLEGSWVKIYDSEIFPPPQPLDPWQEPTTTLSEERENQETTTTKMPITYNLKRNSMKLTEQNKLTLEPSWCYGQRGPLYLVACALNSSTYDHDFKEFLPGQKVAGPPFNDRCLVVTGRCAYACMESQGTLEHCDADGMITQELIDGRDKSVQSRKNDVFAVHMFIWTLLFGFAVKMLAYFPGLFKPYRRAKFYTPEQTKQLKYIAVCTPSGGESKAVVLRNLVGSISSRPDNCQCPFNVLFADEGHRHPQKIMFRSLVSIIRCVPDLGSKAANLKTFTKQWVEDTKKFRLDDCSTEKIAQKLRSLNAEYDEAKELDSKIDALCGLKALRHLRSLGWPSHTLSSSGHDPLQDLEDAILQMRKELLIGEKKFDGARFMGSRAPMPMHMDDCEDYQIDSTNEDVPLVHLHYVARAKPDEDERTIKVQHVARGIWYYKLPKTEAKRNSKKWLQWRRASQVYNYGDQPNNKFLVPLRTSRGKAGGLNFAENYLFEFNRDQEDARSHLDPLRFKYAIFSIADARHQFQSDFFSETLPFFFQRNYAEQKDTMLNTRVAFTQCPQYFQEMPDDSDYLDTNNSNFFRLGCMLRNCCGGVSSCGTNGTWLIRDRRSGAHGIDSVWELDNEVEMEHGFTQVVERRFFHESCKVEDTASSLDRVVKGKYSQYINMRLAYGMAKEATDYLAAVQRWAEGGVVLSLQTFLGCDEGVHMIWAAFLLWVAFVVSLGFFVYGKGTNAILSPIFSTVTGDDSVMEMGREVANLFVEVLRTQGNLPIEWVTDYEEMFFDIGQWLMLLMIMIFLVWVVTLVSSFCHYTTCCGRRKNSRRTRFPTSLAQWARLLITVDNLTYFLWFWTAFFWVGFNYYGAFFKKGFDFDPRGMMVISWVLQVLSWSLIIASCFRYRIGQGMASNEVFFLTLTNIWRTTQMFYITAPLTVYSIIMGTSDFMRNRSYGEDISYWVGGDRGAAAKNIVQYWTLFLVLGVPVTWICFFADVMEEGRNAFPSVLVCTFIGMDALHPCAYLWLGNVHEALAFVGEAPKSPGVCSQFAFFLKRWCQKLSSPIWYRNVLRTVVFSSITSTFAKWAGPVQHVLFPALSIWFPQLGVNSALNLLAGLGR